MKIGKKLVELRNKSGMTQTEVATALGVTYKSVSNWENDEREPNFATLEGLAKLFNVPVGYLFGQDDEKDEVSQEAFIDRVITDLIEDGTITKDRAFETLSPHDQQILLGALNKHINSILKKRISE